MPRSIQSYNGIFGDQTEPFDQLFIHHEPLQKRSSLYNYEITEHFHAKLVQIFFIHSGEGLLLSLGRKIPLLPPCVLVIPSNILHGFIFSSEVSGDVFTISEVEFEQALKNHPSLFAIFEHLQHFPIAMDSPLLKELRYVKNKIIDELRQPDRATAYQISLLLQWLMVNLYRSGKKTEREELETDDRTLKHFHTLKKLIRNNLHEGRSVQFYARKMNLTSVHLNRICKAASQKTALQVIHEHLVKEAKKYLKGTTYSIAEIAYLLDFKNPGHFTKFFKKREGTTPSLFRKEQQ